MAAGITANKTAATSAPRLHFVDGLRALAMLMVLMAHCWWFIGAWQVNLPLGHRHINLAGIFNYGHIGVNLFLLLSGFCLYWPFVKQGARKEPTLAEFARKRCRRILPPYYVALVLFGLLPLLFGLWQHQQVSVSHQVTDIVLHALMLHNMDPAYVSGIDGSLWTLALEFQLYILFPVLVEAYRRFPARGVLLVVFLFCTLFRFWSAKLLAVHGNYNPHDPIGYCLAYSVMGRCFEFALGMFLARCLADLYAKGQTGLRWTDGLFVGVVTLISLAEFKRNHGAHFLTLTDAMLGLCFAVLFVAAGKPNSLAHRLLSGRAIVAIGIFSYSIYLVHLPLVFFFGDIARRYHFTNTQQIAYACLFVAPLMILTGYVFHRLFERPFMNVPPEPKRAPATEIPTASSVLATPAPQNE